MRVGGTADPDAPNRYGVFQTEDSKYYVVIAMRRGLPIVCCVSVSPTCPDVNYARPSIKLD